MPTAGAPAREEVARPRAGGTFRTRPATVAALLAALLGGLAGCRRAARPPLAPVDTSVGAPARVGLPPIPSVTGALTLRVGWPPAEHSLAGRDSTFVFGSLGSGDARLTINGAPVAVAPNGAFLAYLRVPPPDAPRYDLVATRGADTARRAVPVRVGARRGLPAAGALVVDSASATPRGARTLRRDDAVRVSVRAPRNAAVWLTPAAPPDSARALGLVRKEAVPTRVPLVDAARAREAGGASGRRTPDAGDDAAATWVVEVAARALMGATPARLVVARGADTVRLALGPVLDVAAREDTAVGTRRYVQLGRPAVGDTDRVIIGRPTPSGTYKWFFLPGTVVERTGAAEGMTRVRLDRDLEVWVADADVVPLPAGYAPAPRVVGAARVVPNPRSVDLVLVTGDRPPHEIVERGREMDVVLHGTTLTPEILPMLGNDTLVRQVVWRQESTDRARVTLVLSALPYGYDVTWDGARGALVVRVRRAPAVDARRPLAGLTIVVDAGHPPGGATGPTGLWEPVAVLPVAERVRDLLVARGATALMTRTSAEAVPLGDRPAVARRADAHALVSIHLNAFPDGVNPFAQSGTSTLFFHQHSEPLARLVQREMVRRFATRDLGVHYQNLAVARPTWYPAILTEGLFLMIPEHEAAMRSPEGRELYAEAVVDGVEAYFRGLADARAAP